MALEETQGDTSPIRHIRLQSDRPKLRIRDDRLGITEFVQSLAKSICELAPDDGIVLAINGEWGSGKSTAVNMILECIQESNSQPSNDQKIVTLEFNPWWFSGQEDLARAFFSEVASKLDKNVSQKIGDGLRKIARRIVSARDVINTGSGLLPGGPLTKSAVDAAISSLNLIAEDKDLPELRRELIQDLANQEKRLLIVIDDIDRLPADEIRQIFRLVKSVADLPKITYLLTFDRAITERALGDIREPLSPTWHEKIVQATFDIPPIQSADLYQVFLEELDIVIGNRKPTDYIRWGNVFHDCVAPWLRTPRDVTRLINILTISWAPVANEVDLSDFVALETLRLFEPAIHRFIRQNPERLTGLASEHNQDEKKRLGEDTLSNPINRTKDEIKNCLLRLFPKLESIWENHGYNDGFLEIWSRERRVCSKDRFAAYFRYGIGDSALSRDEVEKFIDKIDDKAYVEETISKYATTIRRDGTTKAALLTTELSIHSKSIQSTKISSAIINLFRSSDHFNNAHDKVGRGFLAIPAIWGFWLLVRPLIKRLDDGHRLDTLREAFSSRHGLQALSFALEDFRDSLGLNPEIKPERRQPPLIDIDAYNELSNSLLFQIESAAADYSLLNSTGLIYILLQWSSLESAEVVKAWTDKVLEQSDGAIKIARASIQVVRSHGAGDRVTRESPAVHGASLGKIVNVAALLAKLDTIAEKTVDEDSSKIIIEFRAGLNRDKSLGFSDE